MATYRDHWAIAASTRLSPPRLRGDFIDRPRLIELLVDDSAAATTLITGPAGAGKSILMAQAHAADPNSAWLSIDASDNDPARLWSALIDAVALVRPGFAHPWRNLLTSPQAPSVDRIVPAIVNELVHDGGTLRVFIDDVHLLTNPVCVRSLESFVEQRPPSVQLVIAGRTSPPLRCRKHHLDGQLREITAPQLTMSADEAREMLEAVGVRVDPHQLEQLHDRLEGWVAGLRWAAMAVQNGQDVEQFVASATSLDGDVAKYLVEEMLDRLPDEHRLFMLETSILSQLCDGVCDAIRNRSDSGRQLETLEQSNVMLIATDRGDGWYRYHHLVGDILRARLVRESPQTVPALHRHAAEWLFEHGEVLDAVDHAIAAGDRTAAADMLCRRWWELTNRGQIETAVMILDRFEPSEVCAYQPLAAAAAFIYGVAGDEARSKACYEAALEGTYDGAPPDGSASMESTLAILRASLVLDGVDQAGHDAELAHGLESADSPWRPLTALVVGLCRTWGGDREGALPFFKEVTTAGAADAAIVVYAMAEISLIELDRGELTQAHSTATRACAWATDAGLDAIITTAIAQGAAALSCLALGDLAGAADHLDAAELPVREVGVGVPVDAMRAHLLLAEAALQLGELDAAGRHLRAAGEVDERIGDTGALGGQRRQLQMRLDDASADVPVVIDLTDRESEVLELLASRLTSREIGAELYLSRNTVRTYQQRIYKKLGVTAREDAVVAARKASLLPTRTSAH